MPDLLERTDALMDLEFWAIVEQAEAEEIHWWPSFCWRCEKPSLVWLSLATRPWGAKDVEQNPKVIAAVEAARFDVNPIRAYLEFRTSRPRPQGYIAFCCPHCHSILGDFHLFREFVMMRAAGQTQIVTVRL